MSIEADIDLSRINIEAIGIGGPRGEKGDKGNTGATGATGATGPANTLSIGTVESGETASATITGTSPNQTLNLTLPKGDKGDTGNTGATGATGPANTLSIGTVTSGSTAGATITGQSPNQTLNLVLPKGDKGDKGKKGDTGAQGTTDYIETTNKPQVNGVTLIGNKTTSDLGINIPTKTSDLTNDSGYIGNTVNDLVNYYTKSNTDTLLGGKQETLVSGTNIKTINNESILGSGNLSIQAGVSDVKMNNVSIVTSGVANIPLATSVETGVVKANNYYGLENLVDGSLMASIVNYLQYSFMPDNSFISKGTLNNVLSGRDYITRYVDDLTYYTTTSDLTTLLNEKQDATDNNLTTDDKTIVGAINEVNYNLSFAQRGVGFTNYYSLVDTFNNLEFGVYGYGQSVYIATNGDLWISDTDPTTSTPYVYVSEEATANDLKTNGYIRVGYYTLRPITVLDSGGGGLTDVEINLTSVVSGGVARIATEGTYDATTNKIATMDDLPTDTQDLTNGAGYITSSALSGYATETWVGNQGYITGISSSDVTNALGYTPYDSSNPNGYTSNTGTVTSVNNVSPVNGEVTLTVADIGAQAALGYSPEDMANKVISISSSSTDAEYPSAKCVYDMIGDVETILTTLTTGGGVQ